MAGAAKKLDRSPRVAVIIPTFRRQYMLGLLFKAFGDQKHRNFRIYLSYFDPADIINTRDPKGINDSRIIPVHCKTKGSSAQRNFGLREALKDPEVKYVCFFDDDDMPLPDYLSALVAQLEENPTARACSCLVMDPHRGGYWRHPKDKMGRPVCPPVKGTTPGFLYRREVAKPVWDAKGWFQNARYSVAVLGTGHDHTGDIHLPKVLLVLMRDLQGGLHHGDRRF